MQRILFLTAVLFSFSDAAGAADAAKVETDVVVYGGTPAGITAAISAARQGHRVALIDINAHVGGAVSGGLVDTDIGDRATVGGLADQFLKRVEKYYADRYGPDSRQLEMSRGGLKYEPSVAEAVFESMLKQQPNIQLWRSHRYRSLAMEKGSIVSITVDDIATQSVRTFSGKMFIDASYEGDVMAGAEVPYRVGRESRAEFGEFLAGINEGPREILGLGDHRTQAYNYRVSITSNTANRVLFPKPKNYDPEPWRAAQRKKIIDQGVRTFAGLYVNAARKAGPNDKLDTNWGDLLGGSEGYADGSWETRDRIAQKHRDYFLSLLYYLQNDPELPADFREDAMKWGLPKDEFVDNDHFPFQLYVREGRRMLGRQILKEQDLTQNRYKPDGIATGSYGIDCHVVQTILYQNAIIPERTRHISVDNYDIPYDVITPIEPSNLLVPVCVSATHVAYASLRMEPVYMMLGEAAGSAAHLAISNSTSVQDVSVEKLRGILVKNGGVMDAGYQPPVEILMEPSNPKVGEQVKFSIKSPSLKNPLKNVWWSFGGGESVDSKNPTAEHRFDLEKIHTISLLVEDVSGKRNLVTAQLPVGKNSVSTDSSIDEFDAEMTGRWKGAYPELMLSSTKRTPDVFYGPGSHQDIISNGEKAPVRARFEANLTKPGRYRVCLGFRPSKDQSDQVPVVIRHADGTAKIMVNQRDEVTPFPFVSIGEYRFSPDTEASVEISNQGTKDLIAIDGVRWIWLGE